MRHNHQNIQTTAVQAAASAAQSTHSAAAQASAARLIRALRYLYQTINTDAPALDVSLIEAQKYLCDYLTHVTTPNSTFTENSVLKRHQAIVATIRVIDEIKKCAEQNEDKISVLIQMRSIVNTHPGFKWVESDNQWSKNQIYCSTSKAMNYVTASPAETFNLVCAAFFDLRHMVAFPGSAVDNDRADRIHSLFVYLRNLHNEEKKGNYQICAAGRQHGILFLLNHVFCEQSGIPVELIEDQSTFVLKAMSDFITEQLALVSSQKSNEVVSDWILYQSDMIERAVAPVIAFLRSQFLSEKTDEDKLWHAALKIYLENQFEKLGLDPATCKADDAVANIEYMQPPTADPILHELLKTLRLTSFRSLQMLIDARNEALDNLKTRYRSITQSISSDEVRSLYVAETLFQTVYRHRHHALLMGATDSGYQDSLYAMQDKLIDCFNQKKLSADFDIVKTRYLLQLETIHKNAHTDLIENFFINGKSLDENLNRIRSLSPLLQDNPILVTDEMLAHWQAESAYQDNAGEIDISPYEVNRILVHAMLIIGQSGFEWSERFKEMLKAITIWLLKTPSDASVADLAFRNAYDKRILTNCLCLSLTIHLSAAKKVIEDSFKLNVNPVEIGVASKGIVFCLERLLAAQIDRDQILDAVMPYITELLLTACDFSMVSCHLGDISRSRLFESLKHKLSDLVKSIDNFRTIHYQLPESKRMEAAILLKNKLVTFIKNAADFSFVMGCLPAEERDELFNLFREVLPNYIRRGGEYGITYVLPHLTSDQCTVIYQALEGEWLAIVKSIRVFSTILKYFTSDQRSSLYELFKNNLVNWAKYNGGYFPWTDFSDIVMCLSLNQRADLCELVKSALLQGIKSVYDFFAALKILAVDQRTRVYELFKDKLPDMIPYEVDLQDRVLQYLLPNQGMAVIESLKDKLIYIVGNSQRTHFNALIKLFLPVNEPPHDFNRVLNILTNDKYVLTWLCDLYISVRDCQLTEATEQWKIKNLIYIKEKMDDCLRVCGPADRLLAPMLNDIFEKHRAIAERANGVASNAPGFFAISGSAIASTAAVAGELKR